MKVSNTSRTQSVPVQIFLIGSLAFAPLVSCISKNPAGQNTEDRAPSEFQQQQDTTAQIGEYVVSVFEDSKGNLWFGTMHEGAAMYDGERLRYFTTTDGLPGNAVTCFAEDSNGTLWFGTHSGLSRYDGQNFLTYTKSEGLCHNSVSTLLFDRKGTLWIGTWGGVCTYNGVQFSSVPLPLPQNIPEASGVTAQWISQIIEDRNGNIWFGRDAYGVCMYDGNKFTHLTKDDGLASNGVHAIQEDQEGNIWFGSRVLEKDNADPNARFGDGGLSRYDGKSIAQFADIEGLHQNDIYSMSIDRAGNLWIGANGLGVYKYNGDMFVLYKGTNRMDLTYGMGIQGVLEDRKGNLWFGMSGGLFRLQGNEIVNVTQGGPWE